MFKLIVICVVLNYFSSCKACSCIPFDDPQRSRQIYCTADWVAEITVLGKKLIGDDYHEFNINYTTVYKMPSKFNDTYPLKIYSHQQDSMCGMRLTKNQEYLLVGSINKGSWQGPAGTIGINHCSYLDDKFKQQLQNGTFIDCKQ